MAVRARLTTALELAGFAAVSAGIGAIYWPAGLISAGLTAVGLGVLLAAEPAE